MVDNNRNDPIERAAGPFPAPQSREQPWEAWETKRGPFERRNSQERRSPSPEEDTHTSSQERRRRWGRRKADVLSTEAQGTLSDRSRSFVQRFREPIIGLTLAGVAAPLINAGVNPAAGVGAATKEAKAKDAAAAAAADRDLEAEVGDYWAESEAEVVRASTIEGAVTRWGIETDLAEKIYDYAVKNEIEPDMAYGLVFTESTFRERAVSHVGARGLTQLMPRTAKWLEPSVDTRELFDPDTNLDIGFRYLRQLIDKYEGDVENALTAYNRGPGTVDKILKRGGNPDNGYAKKVLAG